MIRSDRFLDRAAPYGVNGYATYAGEYVTAPFVRTIQFVMPLDRQCISRGVAETADGTVYVWTVRREGHGDVTNGGERRLATLMRSGTFAEHARGLLLVEQNSIERDAFAAYMREVDAL